MNPEFMLPNCARSCNFGACVVKAPPATIPEADVIESAVEVEAPMEEATVATPTEITGATIAEITGATIAATIEIMGSPPTSLCEDDNQSCEFWATRGECQINPGYMLPICTKSCNACGGEPF